MWATLAEHARLFAVDLPGFGASERRDDLLLPAGDGRVPGPAHRRGRSGTAAHRRAGRRNVGRPVRGGGTSRAVRERDRRLRRSRGSARARRAAPVAGARPRPRRSTAAWTRARSSTRPWTRSPAGSPTRSAPTTSPRYEGDRYVESMRYVRAYPEELPELAELLPQITTPVTIINGRHDRVVPVANAEFLARAAAQQPARAHRHRPLRLGGGAGGVRLDHPRRRSTAARLMTGTALAATRTQRRSASRQRGSSSPTAASGAPRGMPLVHAAALPRQPGQLGPGADRCARRRARGHPGRLPGRRRPRPDDRAARSPRRRGR